MYTACTPLYGNTRLHLNARKMQLKSRFLQAVPKQQKYTYTHKMQMHISANAVKTTFDFGEDDEEYRQFKREREEAKKKKENEKQKRDVECQVVNLNKIFYQECRFCHGNDLVDWVKERWGKAFQMSLDKERDEMVLRIYPSTGCGMEYMSTMDMIATKLNDWMLMDYVKETILNYPIQAKKEWVFFGKDKLEKIITIPLNIYYDGTV